LKEKTRPLFAWIGVLIAAGGVFLFSRTVTILSVKNLDHPGSFYFKVDPSEQMTLCYTNSIYNAPVEEVFELRKRDIVLKAVRTDSPAVMEYYGFEGSGPVQTMNRSLGPALSIQRSMRQDQSLRIGKRTFDLQAMANRGDKVQIRVEDVPLASFLLSRMFCHQHTDASIKNP
jgi:hypothetical protein